jgi:hypothetical protein
MLITSRQGSVFFGWAENPAIFCEIAPEIQLPRRQGVSNRRTGVVA